MKFYLKHDLQEILSLLVTLSMMKVSKSLLDIITETSTITIKWLRIDLHIVRDAYQALKVNDLALIQSELSKAHQLTNVKKISILIDLIRNEKLTHLIGKWIFL